MPHVINGIGTWYYGKRNVHRLRNLCSQCGAVNDLESYDTTLYFVVFFVPLVPLGSKRILDSCPACNRHRMILLKKWQQIKSDAVAGVLEKLRADPENRETVLEAISVATSFQDEALFDKMSSVLASDRTEDAELQLALAQANSYFARHGEAATAYMNALRLKDGPRVREQLGLTLLRLGDPEQAAGCFKHILEEANGERLWFLYQLTVAYQAKGMHSEALELLDRVQEKFPATETVKDWQKLRKISVKDNGRNRPVGKSLLQEGTKAGTHEGNRLGALIPMLVLPLLLLAFASWHTWRSITLASARPMYLVNGTAKPYTVAVNGTPVQINPGTPATVAVAEGTITLTPGAGAEGIEPGEVQVVSTFWARPYDGTSIVINPDRLAVLTRETTTYSESPSENPPPEYLVGKLLYEVPKVNHCFEPFPNSVKLKKGHSATHTRLGMAEIDSPESRISLLTGSVLSLAEQAEYSRRWLATDPDNALALGWFLSTAPKDDVLAALRKRLGDRPLRMEWHRAYQSMAERHGEDRTKLRDEYRKLVGELPGDPDALYLLARVTDREESDKLLKEAIASGKPAERAHYALAARALSEGDYATASAEADRFPGLLKGNSPYELVASEVFLAAKRYRDLEKLIGQAGGTISALREKLRICELAGDKAGADQAVAALTGQLPPQAMATLRSMLDALVAATQASVKGDTKAYLAAVGQVPGKGSVVIALLKNDLAGAESAARPPAVLDAAADRGLILLATPTTDTEKFTTAKTAFLDALSAGDHDEKELRALLDSGGANPVKAIRELIIMPSKKRVYAAAAAVWFPNQKTELIAFARKLDFHRDETSLVLNQVLGRVGD